jgi:hypothetical protein
MADLEKMAIKRDRGYLVRLFIMLVLGIGASAFVWRGLTGGEMGGCLASAMLGAEPQDEAPPVDSE